MTQDLVIVTGGAGAGIGQGISRAVAEASWTPIIGDTDIRAAEAFAEALQREGSPAVPVELNVADEASVQRMFVDLVPRLGGRLRGLVNNAGVGLVKRLADVTTAEWDRLHGIDLRGAFFCARAAIPLLAEGGGGSIVNIGSVQAIGPHIGYSSYAAAKAGLVGLTRGIAADHGADLIRCSIIHPGLVDSPQNREIFAAWGDAEQFIDDYVSTRQMIPRLIQPEEVGAAAVFLLSEASRSITASELTLDAGSSRMAFDNTEERG